VGAISPEGDFNFAACYTHNYREFMGGFTNWVEQVADSRSARDYRNRVSDAESASMWQSLSFGANYKAAYCLAVCPAGEDVIGPFLSDRKAHLEKIVRPLQEKQETIYVNKNSDAEDHVARRFPRKKIKHVGNSLRPRSIPQLLRGMSLTFQPRQSKNLNAVYHFTFTTRLSSTLRLRPEGSSSKSGKEPTEATVTIRDGTLQVQDGRQGKADLHVTADSETWLGFLAKERSLLWALLRRKVRIKGPPRLLVAFGKCFPQ
jgi:hypothetical protein